MTPEEFILIFVLWVLGTVVGLVLTGFLADRFVIRKIMANPKVKKLMATIEKLADYAEEIVENQKKKKE